MFTDPPTYFAAGVAAARLGLSRWKFIYLVDRGVFPSPSLQIPGRRLFSARDLERCEEIIAERPELRESLNKQ